MILICTVQRYGMRLCYDEKDGFEEFVGRFGGEVNLGVGIKCWLVFKCRKKGLFPRRAMLGGKVALGLNVFVAGTRNIELMSKALSW